MAAMFEIPVFPIVLTLFAFWLGRSLQARWKKALFNPILIATILVALFLVVTGMDLSLYTQGTSRMSWLMTPASICLAIPMYEQFQTLRKNTGAICAGIAAGSISCVLVLLFFGLLLKLDSGLLISLLPKSITSAIGVPLSELYGGMGGVTTAAIIVSGILANMCGTTLCRLFGIHNPVAQGVAFGTAGHVIATTKASELDPLIGAVSSFSLVVAGLLTAFLFPLLVYFVPV